MVALLAFKLLFFIVECKGSVLKDKEGYIQTPEYPNNYPPYADCEWSVAVEKGYSIVLEFEDVSIAHIFIHKTTVIYFTKSSQNISMICNNRLFGTLIVKKVSKGPCGCVG